MNDYNIRYGIADDMGDGDEFPAILEKVKAADIVTGNEDGAKHAAQSLLYGLSHIGFTTPPNVDTYWVGEAGPGPSYLDTDRDNAFTKTHVKMLAYNTMHLAKMFREHPIPAEGNTME